MARILVVDDEPHLLKAIRMVLTTAGHFVETVDTGEAAVEAYRREPHDALVLDIALPGMTGVETLASIKAFSPGVVAVFITAHGSIASAVEAIRTGGFDYLPKPFDNDELVLKVERALNHRELSARVVDLEEQLEAQTSFAGIVGSSDSIRGVVRRLSRVAGSDVAVLLSGESGTGKELAARLVHQRSARAAGPFVAVNCGAILATTAESELFGHVKGAFTDARADRLGIFERAQRGTVFLDEIADLPLGLQVKLLRVLQEKEVVRLGGSKAVAIDVRVVAASHKNLADEVRAGRFREDLLWRLKVFPVEMPPLRERLEDLPLLIAHLLQAVNAECRTDILGVESEALLRLQQHSWPGNVRELLNVLKHGAIMADGAMIGELDLPQDLSETLPEATTPGLLNSSDQDLRAARTDADRRLIQAALRRFEGNRAAAAAALGISQRSLFYKLKQHRLDEISKAVGSPAARSGLR